VAEVLKLGPRISTTILDPWQLWPRQPRTATPSLSLAQPGSGQGGSRSVPKKEREIHGVDFRVVNWVFPRRALSLTDSSVFSISGEPVRPIHRPATQLLSSALYWSMGIVVERPDTLLSMVFWFVLAMTSCSGTWWRASTSAR